MVGAFLGVVEFSFILNITITWFFFTLRIPIGSLLFEKLSNIEPDILDVGAIKQYVEIIYTVANSQTYLIIGLANKETERES